MKALLRKELGEALVPATCLFVPACFFWLVGANTRDVLMDPDEEIAMTVLAIAGFTGFLIGYCQFAAERWRKTLGYVMHRGTGDGQVFVAKVIAGLVATALIAMGPPIVFALWHKLTAADRAILQMQRITELGWLSTMGVSTYALGVLASQLQRAWWKEVFFGLVGGGALAFLAIRVTLVTPDDPSLPAARYVAIQLAIGLVLLVVAFRLFLSRVDRDLPLPNAVHATLALLGIGLFILPLDFGAATAEHMMLARVRNDYPLVLRERATERVLAARFGSRGDYVEVDANGQRLSNALPLDWSGRGGANEPYEILYDPNVAGVVRSDLSWASTTLNGRWVSLRFFEGGSPVSTVVAANGQFIVTGYLDLHTGVVRVFFNEFEGSRAPVQRPDLVLPRKLPMEFVVEKDRSNRRFSGHTVCLGPIREPQDAIMQRVQANVPPKYHALCAIDLDDRSMWRIDPLDLQTRAREVTLPDGDRLVRLETSQVPGEARPSFFTPMTTVDDGSLYRVSYGYPTTLVVAGERGLYQWTGDRFERFERHPRPAGDVEMSVQTLNAPGLQTYVDPLETSIELRSADGSQVLFSYDYAPRGPRALVTVGLVYLVNIVDSPLAATISFFTTAHDGKGRNERSGWAQASLLHDQHRPLLLLANLALAFFMTKRVVQSLVRRRAAGVTIGVWAITTSVFGMYAYLLFRVFEPRGKPESRAESSAASPLPMLIESRAQERAHAAGSM